MSAPEIGVVTDEFDLDFASACSRTRELGIGVCEIRNVDGKRIDESFSDEDIARISSILRSEGLKVAAISPGLSKEVWTPELSPADSVARLCRLSEVAAKLGSSQIVCFGFRTKGAVEVPSRSWLIDYFGSISIQAERLGITVLLENHSSCAVATTADLVAVVSAVRGRNLGVVWDPANHYLRLRSAADVAVNLEVLLPYLRAVHIKDIDDDGVGCPLGAGRVGWQVLLRRLHGCAIPRLTLEPHRKGGSASVDADLLALKAMTSHWFG